MLEPTGKGPAAQKLGVFTAPQLITLDSIRDEKIKSVYFLHKWVFEEKVTSACCTNNLQHLNTTSFLFSGSSGEEPSADQPSSSHDMTRSGGGVAARERQLLLLHPQPRGPEYRGDGSDLWNLEKMMEELGQKVHRLEEKPCWCPNISTEREAPPGGVDAKLQAEVMWLKKGLEDHLSVFKNVFSNADVLAKSDATLELNKLWELVKNEDGKKEKKRRGGGAGKEGRGGNHRSKKDSSGEIHWACQEVSSSSTLTNLCWFLQTNKMLTL